MSKSSQSTKFRKVDIDELDENKFQDDQVEDTGTSGPDESEVRNLLLQYPSYYKQTGIVSSRVILKWPKICFVLYLVSRMPSSRMACFHVTSSKSNFYTVHSRKLVLSYFLEFHKLSLHPKFWADMEILSGVTDI